MGIKRPENANDINTQLKREHVASFMIAKIIQSLPKDSKYRQVSFMKDVRQKWNKNFAVDGINAQTVTDLLSALPEGEASFDKFRNYFAQTKNVNTVIKSATTDFDKSVADGLYPFSLLDPALLDAGIIPENTRKLTLFSKGIPIYDINGVTPVEVLNKNGETVFTVTSANASALEERVLTEEEEMAQLVQEDYESSQAQEAQEASAYASTLQSADDLGFEDTDNYEEFIGWTSERASDGTIAKPGLDLLLGAYLSKTQQRTARNLVGEQTVYTGDVARNAQYLFNHLRGNGIEFELDEFAQDNTLNVKLNVNGLSMNVLDTRAGYQGSIYDGYARYYLHANRQDNTSNLAFDEQDTSAPLDFLMGLRKGDPIKTANNANSQIRNVEGLRSDAQIFVFAQDDNLLSRWDTLQFRKGSVDENGNWGYVDDVESARDYIISAVNQAEIYFMNEMNEDAIYERVVDSEYPVHEFYSNDDRIKEKQEAILHDIPLIMDMKDMAMADPDMYYVLKEAMKSTDLDTFDLASLPEDPQMVAAALITRVRIDTVGTYVEGFNPAFAVEHAREMAERGNTRDALLKAIQIVDYDLEKLKGNDFAVNKTKDRLLTFNAETAQDIDSVEHPFLKEKMERIQTQLVDLGVIGEDGSIPSVLIDDKGIVEWSGKRRNSHGKKDKNGYSSEGVISGQIGQIFPPDEHGILSTQFNGSEDFGFIPGYTGYFAMNDENMKLDDPTERFRVKGFEQHLNQQIDGLVRHQVLRPIRNSWGNIPDQFDATKLNQIYTKDAYGSRVELDYMENSKLSEEAKTAIVKTLSNRVRFDNQYNEHATTFAQNGSDQDMAHEDEAAFSYWKAAGEQNMRVITNDWMNVVDMNLTGNARNQGIARYLVDGAEVQEDGSVKKAAMFGPEPDETAMMKLDYFSNKDLIAWDRTQMSGHQLQTAEYVAEGTNIMFASFGGWTFEDGFVVSKDFAEQYAIKGDHDVVRPLKRGDKISDFGGNKGVIGLVVDPDMDSAEARELGIEKEVAWMKENRHIEVVGGPYSFLSRHNPGILKEAMTSTMDAVNPETGEVMKNAVGKIDMIVTDLNVDKKTNAYTDDEVAEGKGRKASAQLAWALQSKGADKIMRDIYGYNDAPWEALGEYLMTTGVEMDTEGTLSLIQNGGLDEDRNKFSISDFSDASDFLNNVQDKGGDLQLPFKLAFGSGEKTDQLPILSSKLRKDTELVDGQLRRSQINNYYGQLFSVLADYQAETVSTKDQQRFKKDGLTDAEILERIQPEREEKAQKIFNQVQSEVIDRQLSGKHGIFREKLMGKRMANSATGVAIPDPRRAVGEMGMDKAMREALSVKAGDVIMGWRDPVWRDGAVRAFTVVEDEDAHGAAINPATAKSHDGDFDGDTFGLVKLDSKEATEELVRLFGHQSNMLNTGAGVDENGDYPLYFGHNELDLASANAALKAKGDTKLEELFDNASKNAQSSNPKLHKKALHDFNAYLDYGFQNSHGADYIDLTDRSTIEKSLSNIVEHGAKGSQSKLDGCMSYFDGKKNDASREDAMGIQLATGIKTDDTGLAGAIEQKLVAATRNQDVKAATELGYLPTQMTLQIKHSPDEAKVIDGLLNNEIPRLYRGLDPTDKFNKTPLTTKKWVEHFDNLYGEKLGLDYNKDYVNHLAETLSENNRVRNIKEVMADKASPLDRIAYGGDYGEILNVARKNESLLEGVKSRQFAPLSMQNAEDVVVMSKRDSIDVKRQELLAERLSTQSHPVNRRVVSSVSTNDQELSM